ncbi:putative bifunctional diguanylate cyclase/phosphodiesterase [Falsiroseomonas sp. E2-1-a20]|uniref:putative bifunctional diguanylate cyclase/phosphodiesterase n=1 Tax=Falsiroseomonas sp. E2-1-a20 TaxID=3239300 RepID=UPI003F30630E
MARSPHQPAAAADSVQRLMLWLSLFVVLLTVAAVGVNQVLLHRLLIGAAAVWAQGLATDLLRQDPALPQLLRGEEPGPGQLEHLAGIATTTEITGFRLLRPDGSVLLAVPPPHVATAAAPRRRHQSTPREAASQAPIPAPDKAEPAGLLVITLRENGRRAALRDAFGLAQFGVGGFGASMLLLLVWLGHRGRRAEAEATRARHLLRHDRLTGLLTHAELRERLALALVAAQPLDQQVAVLVLNLRGFRQVNALHGRATGDAVLAALAGRLRTLVRRSDTVARLSADRFAVVQTSPEAEEDAAALAHRLAAALAAPLVLPNGQSLALKLQIGFATAPKDAEDAELLLACAEAALSSAGTAAQPDICGYDAAMDTLLRLRRETEEDLRLAIEQGTLTLHYQPQRRLGDRALLGFEALLRWPHATRGLISPAEFIPLAEQTGLIVPLGAWVLHTACAEAAQWPGEARIAVNLSPAQFRHGDLVATVAAALATTGLPARRLELEVTESLLQDDPEDVVRLLRDLRALGVSIAMDDFGTGWSSLAHLWRFPFGKLKIDRAFITEMPRDPKLRAIVTTIVGLGRILDMTVIAEGVETEEQARLLAAEGCEQGQGWLFGRPMPAATARRLIAEDQSRAARSAA